jgi:SCY1-like protein 1
MKLGGSSAKRPATTASLADAIAAEFDDDEVANAWGTDDLMDVNADTEDWTAFESAPVEAAAPPPAQSYYITPEPVKPKPAPAPKAKPAPPPVSSPPVPRLPPAVSQPQSPRSSTDSKPTTPAPSLANMSKEEKDKEMARRREERKARIAAMKDAKKK